MKYKYLLNLFILFLTILSIILVYKFTTNKYKYINENFTDGYKAFCDTHSGFNLEKACNDLTQYNCKNTSCCVYTNENKCKAGNKNGPIFSSDTNGKTVVPEYYYFHNKCFGTNCHHD